MRVTYNLPSEVISAVEGRSAALGVTVDDYVAEHLRNVVIPTATHDRVVALVEEGKCDAEIAASMSLLPGRVASIRRDAGLPANRRYERR